MLLHSVLPLALIVALPFLPATSPQEGKETTSTPVVDVPIHPGTICPIMGKPISTRLFVDTAKGRFWVCCKACYEEILADLDLAHSTAYPEVVELELETCPVTGEPLPEEPHRAVVQGFDVPLCCESCTKHLLADSQLHLALLVNDKLQDMRNPRCPITGDAVTSNSYCTIGDVLVRLSSPMVVDEVRKDPKGALAAAKASVEKHGALARPRCPEREAREQAGEGKEQQKTEKGEDGR